MDPISQETVEELLRGNSSPQALSPELAKVAHLMQIAQAPATSNELAGSHSAVEAFMAAGQYPISTGGKEKVLSKFLSAKAAIAAAAIALTGGAAVTGALVSSNRPASIPNVATVNPSTQGDSPLTNSGSTSTLATVVGENQGMVSGHSLFGLCTAYFATTKSSTGSSVPSSGSTAFTQLASVAAANYTATNTSSVAGFCTWVLKNYPPGTLSGHGKGSNASSAGSANASQGSSHSGGGATPQGGATISSSAPNMSVPPVSLPGHASGASSKHS